MADITLISDKKKTEGIKYQFTVVFKEGGDLTLAADYQAASEVNPNVLYLFNYGGTDDVIDDELVLTVNIDMIKYIKADKK